MDVEENFMKRLKNRGTMLNSEYIDSETPVILCCDKGHYWETLPSFMYFYRWCCECKECNMEERREFLESLKVHHP